MLNISNSNKPSLVNLKSSNSLHFLFPQPYLPHDGGPTRFCALWGCNWRMLDVKKLLGNALLWPLISRLPQPNLSQGGATLPTVLFLVDVWDAENNGLWACLTIPPAISMKQYNSNPLYFFSRFNWAYSHRWKVEKNRTSHNQYFTTFFSKLGQVFNECIFWKIAESNSEISTRITFSYSGEAIFKLCFQTSF